MISSDTVDERIESTLENKQDINDYFRAESLRRIAEKEKKKLAHEKQDKIDIQVEAERVADLISKGLEVTPLRPVGRPVGFSPLDKATETERSTEAPEDAGSLFDVAPDLSEDPF